MSLLTKVGSSVADFIKVGDDAVPQGFQRFYRAQGPKNVAAEMSDDMAGRYFTPHLDSAFNYAREAPDREVLSLDVSFGDMYRHNINPDSYEQLMPEEIISQAKPYYSRTRQMQAQDQQRSSAFLSRGHSSARQGLPIRTLK